MIFDENLNVIRAVAENPNNYPDTLKHLTLHKDKRVRQYVAGNEKTDIYSLITILEYEKTMKKPNKLIIKALYNNKNLPLFAKRVIKTIWGHLV